MPRCPSLVTSASSVQVEQPLPWRAHPTQKRSAETVRYLPLAPGLLDVAAMRGVLHSPSP